MGVEKNKGLAYYRYMFCTENRQILAIVDWPLIGVDRLQRCSARMTYKVVLKFVATYHSSVFEWCQHQLVANQQSPKSGDSLHKTCNGSTPDPYFSPPPYQKKNKRSGHARLPLTLVHNPGPSQGRKSLAKILTLREPHAHVIVLTNGWGRRGRRPIVSRGQTAYFSFDMGAEKNKGLAYYRCMFCAQNHQILAIVD